MDRDPYKYFRVESSELLEGLGRGVLALERGVVIEETIGGLLRLAHTLKGAARIVKQAEIAELAHRVEDALAPHRRGDAAVPQATIDALLALIDAIGGKLTALDRPPPPAPGPPGAPARPGDDLLETVRVEISRMDEILESTAEVGSQLSTLRERIGEVDEARRLASALLARLAPRHAPREGRAHALAEALRARLETLRRELSGGLDAAEKELAQTRETAASLRLVPAGTVFPSLERAARDIARQLGKRVSFEASGGQTRLDAPVLAALRDALLHVVRNAAAHGIEAEAERVRAGKPPIGKVTLEVEQRGDRIAFRCRDDGAGIDVGSVRREAARRGLIAPADAAALPLDEALRLILRSGITTMRAVTQTSGRGVGLDVLRETAARLKGEVAIASEPGRGARIEVCVPVSLLSLAALRVEAGGTAASLPLDAVRAAISVAPGDVARSGEAESIVFEEKVIPFMQLARALRPRTPARALRRAAPAIVVQADGALAALGVDRLLGATHVIVQPLPPLALANPVVTGATLDGRGNPQLFLDPRRLVAAARAAAGASGDAPEAARPVILVVDDSLTTRMLEQSILESAGYEVDLATSGEEALTLARRRPYALFVVDVEMPGMDGFTFVETARADPALGQVPAILVTSRNAPEDLRRGEEAGARAYIVKSEFDQGVLLRSIRDLVG